MVVCHPHLCTVSVLGEKNNMPGRTNNQICNSDKHPGSLFMLFSVAKNVTGCFDEETLKSNLVMGEKCCDMKVVPKLGASVRRLRAGLHSPGWPGLVALFSG